MTKIQNEKLVDQELAELAGAIGKLPRRKTGGLIGAPNEIRSWAVRLWIRSGIGGEEFCKRIGIGEGSLSNWRSELQPSKRKHQESSKAAPTKKLRTGFREMAVRDKERPALASADQVARGSNMVLELGNGARISGIGIQDVLHLIQCGRGER